MSLLRIPKKKSDQIFLHYCRYRFLAVATAYDMFIADAVLRDFFHSYFYMPISTPPLDWVDKFQLEMDDSRHTKRLAQRYIHIFSNSFLLHVLHDIGLPVNQEEDEITGQHPDFEVLASNHVLKYKINVMTGTIFKDALFYSHTPLEVLSHPVCKQLGLDHVKTCLTSLCKTIILIEQPHRSVRFIKNNISHYTVQQARHTQSEKKKWYQLTSLSTEQRAYWKISTHNILNSKNLPDIFKERFSLAWIREDKQKILFFNQQNEVAYVAQSHQKQENKETSWKLTHAQSKTKIAEHNPKMLEVYNTFEISNFILIHKEETGYTISLPRYDLQFSRSEEGKSYFNLHGTLYQLKEKERMFDNMACLQWTHEKNEIALLAIQPFIKMDTRERKGEYYECQQDISATISFKVIEKMVKDKKAPDITRLWQYSGTASYFVVKIKDGRFFPLSPAQALFTCYVYLGAHQPENAWRMLDRCEKELGGLSGTDEEIRYLRMICSDIPYQINDQDEKAIICNPYFVACQLKALALLVARLQQKTITLTEQAFDTSTVNGIFDQHEFKRTGNFYYAISAYIGSLFSTLKKMRRDTPESFTLSEIERARLLNFYHAQATNNKAIGALGYEWTQLYFNFLSKEWKTITKKEKAGLATAYEIFRKKEIEHTINTHPGIFKIGSTIEKKEVNLTIFLTHESLDKDTKAKIKTFVNAVHRARDTEVDEFEIEIAIKFLSPKMSESNFSRFLYQYFTIAFTPEHRYQEDLKDFCKATLITHDQIKHSKQLILWCEVLYLGLHTQEPAPIFKEFIDCIQYAKKLPPQSLFRSEWVENHQESLISAKDLWEKQITDSEQHYSLHDEQAEIDENDNSPYSANHMPSAINYFDQWNILEKQFNNDTQSGIEKYQTLMKLKTISVNCFNNKKILKNLEKMTGTQLKETQRNQKTCKQSLLLYANQGPDDPTLKIAWKIDVTSQKKSALTIKKLLKLYSQANSHKYFKATHLSKEKIIALHAHVSEYITYALHIQQLKRIQKCIINIKKSKNTAEKKQLFFLLAKLLFSKNIINGIEHSDIIFFQYQKNILLRQQQLNNISQLITRGENQKYAEIIIKMIPGEGKSTVISPIIARKKTTGSNLVILAIPQSLLNSCYTHMFEFHRENHSHEKLKTLYEYCVQAMVNKNKLETSVEMLQAVELHFIDLLLSKPKEEETEALADWDKKIYWLDKLLNLFRHKGDLMIDEVHQGLSLRRKLNFTRAESSTVSQSICNDMILLYQFFEYVTLGNISELAEGLTITLKDVLKNNKLFSNEKQFNLACQQLGKQLAHHEHSPLYFLVREHQEKYNDNITELLENYLLDQASDVPLFVANAAPEIQETLALYKEQVSHFLPHTLQQNQNEHYGPLKPIDDDTAEVSSTQMIAVPYLANNIPSKVSHFGIFLITINYTIQSMLITGIPKNLLRTYFENLLNQAKQTLYTHAHYKHIDDTPAADIFNILVNDSAFFLSMLNSESETELLFTQLHRKLKKSEALIYEILKTDILKKITVNAEVLSSDAYNLVDMVYSCQGMTATPENYRTFHWRLKYNDTTHEDDYIHQVLKVKNPKVYLFEFNQLNLFIDALLSRYHPSDNVRAIIDISATFRTPETIITNMEIAEALARYLFSNPKKITTSLIKYVLFFIESDLYAIRVVATETLRNNTPIFIGDTHAERIKERLNCSQEEYFTFYDQIHFLGVDIKHTVNAKALVMIDHRTLASNIRQGVLRMRDLLEGDQSFDCVVSKPLANKSFDEIYERAKILEENQLEEELFEAAQLKMRALIRSHLLNRIYNVFGQNASKEKNRLILCFYPYFASTDSFRLYEKYGAINKEDETNNILTRMKVALIANLEKIIASANQTLSSEEKDEIVNWLDFILKQACEWCSSRQRLRHTQKDAYMQVEKQVQINNMIEKKIFNQVCNLYYQENDYCYIHFGMITDPQSHFKTLNQICKSTDTSFTSYFSENIFVTPNFYITYKKQVTYIGEHLKPVYALLFSKLPKFLTCLILSQEECTHVYLSVKYNKNYWLVTTQNTPLMNTTPPEEMQENEHYLAIIEQMQFLNGEINLLLKRTRKFYWLEDKSQEKINFFTQYIYLYRETSANDLYQLKTLLIGFHKACLFIADHPDIDGGHFDWNAQFPNLDSESIKECKQLARFLNSAVENWPEKSSEEIKQKNKDNFSLAAQASISRFISKKEFFMVVLNHVKKTVNCKTEKDYEECMVEIRELFFTHSHLLNFTRSDLAEPENAERSVASLLKQTLHFFPYLAEKFRILIICLLCKNKFSQKKELNEYAEKSIQHEEIAIVLLSNPNKNVPIETISYIVTQSVKNPKLSNNTLSMIINSKILCAIVSMETIYSIYMKQFYYLLMLFEKNISSFVESDKVTLIARVLIENLAQVTENFNFEKITQQIYIKFEAICARILEEATMECRKIQKTNVLKSSPPLKLPQSITLFKSQLKDTQEKLEILIDFKLECGRDSSGGIEMKAINNVSH